MAALGNRPTDRKAARLTIAVNEKQLALGFLLAAGVIGSLLGGCASAPTAQAPAAADHPPAAVDSAESPVVPALAADEQLIGITSEPAGARVLVNNRLIGRTPLELRVKVTSFGFCVDYVTVKARFVTDGGALASHTVETELTPREKAPARMNFTPEGVQWRLK